MEKELFGICPYTTTQYILSGKWTILILYHLSEKTMRFNEIQRALGHITQSTLTKQLRTMEDNGLIIRKIYSQIPPKVEYSLSDLGRKFIPVLDALGKWGEDYIQFLKTASTAK